MNQKPTPQYSADTVLFSLDQLPVFSSSQPAKPEASSAASQRGSMVGEVTTYLSHLVANQNRRGDTPPYVMLPSTYSLALFFKCPEVDIEEALETLRSNQYAYEVSGGYHGLICLRDPQGRHSDRPGLLRRVFNFFFRPQGHCDPVT